MARTKKKRWSYSTGERGRNRVRVFEHSTGVLMLEFYDDGKRTRVSLGHQDRGRAKRKAEKAAADLAKAEEVGPVEPEEPKELLLGELFDMYGEEVTPTKGEHTRRHDKRASEMFTEFFGRDRAVMTLDLRDWNRFIQDRGSGKIKPTKSRQKGGVGNRMIEQDLRFLLAVFNWATMCRADGGGVLLERNPCKGFPVPKEKNPRRIVLSEEQYQALRAVAGEVDWRFEVALVLAHETGHRIGAVRELRWSDIDLDNDRIRWRAESEKTGYEHVTPLTAEARWALEQARKHNPGIGETPILSSPKNPSEPISRHLARDYWNRGVKLARLAPTKGRGWHSLRRKFASDLMHKPLKVLSELGGWKEPQTILKCYQHPDQDQLREALADRRTASGSG